MTKEQIAEAKRLRAEGFSYRAIEARLGVSNSTILRWLNPAKDEQYRQNRRDRYATDPDYAAKERKRARESGCKRYATDPEFRERTKRRAVARKQRLYASCPEFRLNLLLHGSRYRAKKHGYAPCNATCTELLAAFTGQCDCCGIAEADLPIRLVIDHNHRTGDFRGFLCNNCNRGIGLLSDLPNFAVEYLTRETAS